MAKNPSGWNMMFILTCLLSQMTYKSRLGSHDVLLKMHIYLEWKNNPIHYLWFYIYLTSSNTKLLTIDPNMKTLQR